MNVDPVELWYGDVTLEQGQQRQPRLNSVWFQLIGLSPLSSATSLAPHR